VNLERTIRFLPEDKNDWLKRLKGAPKEASPVVKPGGLRPKRTSNPKRVLIIEDDLDSARSLFVLLDDMGHTADYAINGYVAFDVARRFRPDVILLDIGLPGPNGLEVCERIKADPDLKHARIIVITGYSGDEFRIQSQKAGCELHLIKPVPVSVIEHLLR